MLLDLFLFINAGAHKAFSAHSELCHKGAELFVLHY